MPDQQQDALMLERLAAVDDPIFYTSPGELLAQAAEEERRRAAGPRIRMVKAPRPAPAPDQESEASRSSAPAIGGARLPAPGDTVNLDDETQWWRKDAASGPGPEPAAAPAATPAQVNLQKDNAQPAAPSEEEVQEEEAEEEDGRDTPTQNSRLRALAFNAVAAGAGYGTGLVTLIGRVYPFADEDPTSAIALVFAAVGAYAGWKLICSTAVSMILPGTILRACAVITPAWAALLGYRMASAATAWLAEKGAPIGLGTSSVALVTTAAALCGGLWWCVDRRTRHWHWTGRLVVRIPLASALLATALYAPGIVSFS
ncbi:hypothetical protein EYS09_22185 [Streptomyces kasugaensis]|uniref:Uncharacterized protein n=1 Tax=Streptomyces kasugaensis TaxID=1946 RepID=A0A4Q9HRC0_STRKA|nr:hypothetical protein [Streptomyces kasugaensis]TBO57523.1 hypothetical protein EYS09_22185 [Streptomyces kasugaensis]